MDCGLVFVGGLVGGLVGKDWWIGGLQYWNPGMATPWMMFSPWCTVGHWDALGHWDMVAGMGDAGMAAVAMLESF